MIQYYDLMDLFRDREFIVIENFIFLTIVIKSKNLDLLQLINLLLISMLLGEIVSTHHLILSFHY